MGHRGYLGGVQPSHRPKPGKHGRFSLLQPSHHRPEPSQPSHLSEEVLSVADKNGMAERWQNASQPVQICDGVTRMHGHPKFQTELRFECVHGGDSLPIASQHRRHITITASSDRASSCTLHLASQKGSKRASKSIDFALKKEQKRDSWSWIHENLRQDEFWGFLQNGHGRHALRLPPQG